MGIVMYEYKKIIFDLKSSDMSLQSKHKKEFERMFEFIEKEARDGWRFVQAIHLFPNQNSCMLVFEKELPLID